MWRQRGRRATGQSRRDGSSRESRAGARLAREAEAFLSGSSREWFLERGRDVPAWAYVNKVAHSDAGCLERLARSAPEVPAGAVGWQDALALLAREVVEAAGRERGGIRAVQLDRLAALESQLISPAGRDLVPRELVALGRACLRNHPSWDPPA